MKIAFLNPQGNFDPQDRYWTEHPDFGGQLVYVKELSLALGRMGHSVDIITRQIQDPEWPGFEAELDAYPGEPNVRIVRLPCGGPHFLRKEDLWPHLGAEWVPNIVEFYAEQGGTPQSATAHYGDGGLAGALWRTAGGPPFTFTAHSLGAQKLDRLLAEGRKNLAQLNDHYRFAVRLAAERAAMNHADCVVTSTQQERLDQYAHAAYREAIDPTDDHRFAVVPPGVNLEIFDADAVGPEDEHIAGYLERMLSRDLSDERIALPVVISSSRLDRKKNHLGIVRAFAQSAELSASANLLIVVRGAESIHSRQGLTPEESQILDEIASLIEQAGLWGTVSVFSLEGQHQLAAAYRILQPRRAVFCLTSLYEPFGLAPLEAMSAGLPVVVTRNGGPSESLHENGLEFGILVDPNDPMDIASGLLRLVTSDTKWQTMRRLGRERVLEKYTWERTAEGYLPHLAARAGERLAIPAYFLDPTPENENQLPALSGLWSQAA